MRRFKLEFSVLERNAYSTTVEAETPEEAIKLFQEQASDYDWEPEELINSEIFDETIEAVGEWEKVQTISGGHQLKRFETPVKLIE